MDKKNFLHLLLAVVVTIFFSIFFSFWFFFGRNKNQEYINPENNVPTAVINANDSFKQMNKMIENQQKYFDQINQNIDDSTTQGNRSANFLFAGNNLLNMENSASIRTEELKDSYKITVNLKPFNNDPNNIDLKVKGNRITISAKYKSKNKNEFNSSQFYESLTLPSKLDAGTIKKQKEGSNLIIVIPKEDTEKSEN